MKGTERSLKGYCGNKLKIFANQKFKSYESKSIKVDEKICFEREAL